MKNNTEFHTDAVSRVCCSYPECAVDIDINRMLVATMLLPPRLPVALPPGFDFSHFQYTMEFRRGDETALGAKTDTSEPRLDEVIMPRAGDGTTTEGGRDSALRLSANR